MRIGLVCPYSLSVPGGVQNHVLGLAGHLHGAGHEIAVLAPGRPATGALLRHGIAPDRFTSAGRAVPLPYNGSVARVNLGPGPAVRVRRWLGGGFDLLHVHEPVTPSISLLTLLAAEAPVVATFHTANPHSRLMRLAGRLLTGRLERLGARIAVSETARAMAHRHLGLDAEVIPNGFCFADLAGAPPDVVPLRRRVPTQRPRIVFLGRVNEPRKGLDVLLRALPELRRHYPGVQVVVAGRGRRAVPDGCLALGTVDDATRARVLADADVFVAPHLDRESFGLVLIEAMAAGAPVVASDLQAFADVLAEDGEPRGSLRGRLFPAGDHEALTSAVLATLNSTGDSLLSQRRAARSLTLRYDWAAVGPRIEQVYERVLGLNAQQPGSLSLAGRSYMLSRTVQPRSPEHIG